jgi:hypothetical protein
LCSSFFFCAYKRKTEPKRKNAGCRSEAKFFVLSRKERYQTRSASPLFLDYFFKWERKEGGWNLLFCFFDCMPESSSFMFGFVFVLGFAFASGLLS